MRTRFRLVGVVGIAALAALAPAALARGSAGQPTTTQVRSALTFAQRSRALWATINVCNTGQHPDMLGIRAQMPSLGFKTALTMDFQVDYWNFTARHFKPDPGVRQLVELGHSTTGVHQGGVVFRFNPPAVLSGTVTFRWMLGRKVLGEATRLTAHGVHGVDFGDPLGFSTATCRIS